MSGWPQCPGEGSFAAAFLSKGPQPPAVTAHESHQSLALGFPEIILPSYRNSCLWQGTNGGGEDNPRRTTPLWRLQRLCTSDSFPRLLPRRPWAHSDALGLVCFFGTNGLTCFLESPPGGRISGCPGSLIFQVQLAVGSLGLYSTVPLFLLLWP